MHACTTERARSRSDARTLAPALAALLPLLGVACGEMEATGPETQVGTEATSTATSSINTPPAQPCADPNAFPGYYEVYIYRDSNFGTHDCRVLSVGFYPTPSTLALPNDSISSIKVGSLVRFRGFRDANYGGEVHVWPSGTPFSAIPGWNDSISSARVETTDHDEACSNLVPGEIGFYRGSNASDDCVVVKALAPDGITPISYATMADMGFSNDSLSSVRNLSDSWVTVIADANWSRSLHQTINPQAGLVNLPHNSCLPLIACGMAIGDNVSSVWVGNMPFNLF